MRKIYCDVCGIEIEKEELIKKELCSACDSKLKGQRTL